MPVETATNQDGLKEAVETINRLHDDPTIFSRSCSATVHTIRSNIIRAFATLSEAMQEEDPSPEVQFAYAYCVIRGWENDGITPAKAKKIIRRLAEEDKYPRAQYQRGLDHVYGRDGLETNLSRASNLFKAAARQEYTPAARMFGKVSAIRDIYNIAGIRPATPVSEPVSSTLPRRNRAVRDTNAPVQSDPRPSERPVPIPA